MTTYSELTPLKKNVTNKQRYREEATGTRAVLHITIGPSSIIVRRPLMIVIALTMGAGVHRVVEAV